MIIARADESCLVSKTNLSRIPADILKQLNKLKPKPLAQSGVAANLAVPTVSFYQGNEGGSPTGTASHSPEGSNRPKSPTLSHSIPGHNEQAVLVEFCGTHDFGWVRTNLLLPFPEDGSIQIPEGCANISKAQGVKVKRKRFPADITQDSSSHHPLFSLLFLTIPTLG